MVSRSLDQKLRQKHVSSRDRLNDKPTPVVVALKRKGKGKGREEQMIRSRREKFNAQEDESMTQHTQRKETGT